MSKIILLPYDGSPVARAALLRTACAIAQGRGLYGGFVLAVAGVDRGAVDRAIDLGAAIAGTGVPIGAHFLTATDPLGSLRELVESLPEITLAVPLDVKGSSPWFARACRSDLACAKMLLFISRDEVRRATVVERRPPVPVLGGLRTLLRTWRGRSDPYPAPLWSAAEPDRP